MVTIPAPTHAREEWPDADFDLPEGDVIPPPTDAVFDKDEDEDWDIEMDLGKTGGAKVIPLKQVAISSAGSSLVNRSGSGVSVLPVLTSETPIAGDDDDEGISTIKVSALPPILKKAPDIRVPIDEDMESDFALPSDLTQLSLRPLSLNHRHSKVSLEWGDRDHTSSSASSSDAYSSLGLSVEASPSTNSTSASLPGTDDDCDEEEDGVLDGLVIPSGLFETDQGRKQLLKILDSKKKKTKVEEQVKVATPDPEDDFEIGLVINGDGDFHASKLVQNQQSKRSGTLSTRSNSMPARPTLIRPPSRLKGDRPKTPLGQAGPSGQTASRLSISPPLRPSQSRRAHTFQTLPLESTRTSPPSSFLTSKPAVIRNQKSHGVLKSPSPPSTHRNLNRKASLSSLLETSNAQASASTPVTRPQQSYGYSATTASSRARTHTNSTSRMYSADIQVPPSRPSTPSSNPIALRLTMPTSMTRFKSRPPISSVFPPPTSTSVTPVQTQGNRSPPTQPIILRPPSRISPSASGSAKVLRRTKRRVFGDGSELDGIEDLPTDRDQEARYRVQPKIPQNRIPGASYPKQDKEFSRGTIRRKKDSSEGTSLSPDAFSSLRHKQSRVDSASKTDSTLRRRPPATVASAPTKRKPTLIRNLGGAGAVKVVGEMRWNPQTLRWEGNDHVLRDFDAAIGTSVRPALITHLTGSSIGSPVGNFGPTARVVGNMVFDPVRLCWMSTLAPEEDEPDVFADMADDEEDDGWEGKGGTIRASLQPSRSTANTSDTSSRVSDASRMQSPSPVQSSHGHSRSESGSDRGSRASIVFDVEDNFVEMCRAAEGRHRIEMKGWSMRHNELPGVNIDRKYLYDIRALATKQY